MFTNPRQSIGALRLMIPLMLALWSAASAEEIRRESDPHEHGAAELHVVLEGTTLHLELRVPAMNVVGFEHAPSDDEQRRAIAAVGETLGRSADVFMPTPQAGCREKRAHATFEAFEQGHEDDEKRAGQDGKERHGEP